MGKLLLAACVLAGCGGSSSGSGDDAPADAPPMLPPEMLVDALEAAQCDAMVRCEQVEDRATCDAANILLDQETKSLLAAIADGTVSYDAAAAQACVAWLGMQDCAFPGFHVDSPCDHVFAGTVAMGGACFIDRQCAAGGACNQTDPMCDTNTSCCPGTCGAGITESQAGGPCDDGAHVCSNDTYCSAKVCTALVATEAASCQELDACADPMYCNINPVSGIGACKTAAASGAPCVRTDLRPCSDSRDYCAASTLTCTRGAQPGESCANGVQCIDWAKCIANQCVADRKLDETCTTGPMAANCAGTLVCTAGTCQAPPEGMTCAL